MPSLSVAGVSYLGQHSSPTDNGYVLLVCGLRECVLRLNVIIRRTRLSEHAYTPAMLAVED